MAATLEQLQPGKQVTGIYPDQPVVIINVRWHGNMAVELTYKRPDGSPASQLVYRSEEAQLTVTDSHQLWTFAAQGDAFRLAAEAYRFHLAHLFDPVLAVHTSLVEPLPHQITAVYSEMLRRHPLRYLLADDPGAGKTIMAGILIKELIVRGDVRRCLICAPGSLAMQWQDELWYKFQLRFEILTRDSFETALSGNPFAEKERVIIRLDHIARNERLQAQLERTDWDLIIIDEAHKMSASFWSGELKRTRRYQLGQKLSQITRHFLLMTATPHNGREEDFQLFLALLDPDRFEGRFREGVHQVDIRDIMRRMVKEELRRFDGRPLFPERRAYTINYQLSPAEARLYRAVTDYVRAEFNRADQLLDDRRRGTVGFALTVLQRRLASSPAAIYQSLSRRRQRLERRLQEVEAQRQQLEQWPPDDFNLNAEELEDLDDAPAEEVERIETSVMDAATAALTVAELEAEINTLINLERMAAQVTQPDHSKWNELASLLQETQIMLDAAGQRRKLIIFTENRDTLDYLYLQMSTLFGRPDTIVQIHGGLSREQRRAAEERFRNHPDVHFLLATDAAGEGINLQRAHLMINYDLPWNPNRLEQRFGRIHRIGQTEVCHLWNLVAGETREGYVYQRLLSKLQAESNALDEKVFNILGELFRERPLRELLLEAVRYGDQPEVRARLEQAVENAVDRDRVRQMLETQSLITHTLDLSQIEHIRADMERYAARRLQPHYIRAFFLAAFTQLGGALREREPGRYSITHVPAVIRHRAEHMGAPVPVLSRYDRVCFDKQQIQLPGKPLADFLCPGHPLLDAVIAQVLERDRQLLRQGTTLVDPTDAGPTPRLLLFLEQSIRDAAQRTISQEVHFVEIDLTGQVRSAGYAPYLDYRPLTPDELAYLRERQLPVDLDGSSADPRLPAGVEMETLAINHAIESLIPRQLQRIREQRDPLISKTLAAVQDRLTREILYWDQRADELQNQERAGRPNARLNSTQARQRADQLAERLERRKAQLQLERQIAATPPLVIGGAHILPAGFFSPHQPPADPQNDTSITEAIAMRAVMKAEITLGNHPQDVSRDNAGYDIESFDPRTGRLRFIEVKGRRADADTITVTHNEILTALNQPEQFILAVVEIEAGQARPPRYIRRPFTQEPEFHVTSINYKLHELLARSQPPA